MRQAHRDRPPPGTNHAWINRGASICGLAMVFVDAEEPPRLARPLR